MVDAALQIVALLLFALFPLSLVVAIGYVVLLGIGGGFSQQPFFQLWSGEMFPTMLRSTALGLRFAAHRAADGPLDLARRPFVEPHRLRVVISLAISAAFLSRSSWSSCATCRTPPGSGGGRNCLVCATAVPAQDERGRKHPQGSSRARSGGGRRRADTDHRVRARRRERTRGL